MFSAARIESIRGLEAIQTTETQTKVCATEMLTTDKMLRLFVELIFVLLGGLVVWLGVTGHILFDRRRVSWLVLSVAVIAWGARVLLQRRQFRLKWENLTRGLSLALVGALMLAISRVPFVWVGPLLTAAGALLALRGFVGAVLLVSRAS